MNTGTYVTTGNSVLTSTTNILLNADKYKNVSVKSSLLPSTSFPSLKRHPHTVEDADLQKKQKSKLTSTKWKDSHLLHESLPRFSVTNKYISVPEKGGPLLTCLPDFLAEEIEDGSKHKKKKKTRAKRSAASPRNAQFLSNPCTDFTLLDFECEDGASEYASVQNFSLPSALESETDALCNESQTFSCRRRSTDVPDFGGLSYQSCVAFGAAVPPAAAPPSFKNALFGFAPIPEMKKMPVYHFKTLQYPEVKEMEFRSLEDDEELLFQNMQMKITKIKTTLLNLVCTSLMASPNYKDINDTSRIALIESSDSVVSFDPEFILKVALYARQELNIRSTSNFLLAYAAYNISCRPFIRKYFSASICLPSDWLEVAELYVTFQEEPSSLPAILRKVMSSSFAKFDEYQLAKYNRKHKKNKKKSPEMEIDINKNKSFSLKNLIRTLHISSPVEPIMCLLGKKYPADPEHFRKSGLPGTWKKERAGQRMKLPVPETWETAVASGGNKSSVWESLIENSKLPYMATLRNLKNLITSGISNHYHQKVIKYITNKNAVLKSRQFPLRFYSAYKMIEEMELLAQSEEKPVTEDYDATKSQWKIQQMKHVSEKMKSIDTAILKMYKGAVNTALEISAMNNVDPISGNTLVICDLVKPFKDVDRDEKACHNCILLGLIALKVCEECELKLIFDENHIENAVPNEIQLLENVSMISSLCKNVTNTEHQLLPAVNKLLATYLYPNILLTKKLDNIIFLIGSYDVNAERLKRLIDKFLHKYRQLANPDLLYVQVNITASANSGTQTDDFQHVNDIYLSGFSDQVLKFISEKGNGKQVAYVDNIDKKYELFESGEASLKVRQKNEIACNMHVSPYNISSKWQSVKVFISSTFKDMHGERDLLIRYVFPDLKRRGLTLFVTIAEIDLRWGINEDNTGTKKCAELCLREAQNCDIFVGILGERYGTIYEHDIPDDPQFGWMENYSSGSSMTELEIEAGAFQRKSASKLNTFFYFRSNNFLSRVPEAWKHCFESEDETVKSKQQNLKDRIRKSGFQLYDGYSCHWGGVAKGKPFVAGLDAFGEKVLSDTWQYIEDAYSTEKQLDEISEEQQSQYAQIDMHSNFVGEQNTPLNWLMKELKNKDGIFVVTGPAGCGKTAFIARLVKEIGIDYAIPFFIGVTSRSLDVSFMLNCISYFISNSYPGSVPLTKSKQDIVNQFHDVLVEGVRAAGGNLVLIIDGLDYLDSDSQILDWLPSNIPKGVKIICSASTSTVSCQALSRRAQVGLPVYFAPLTDLTVVDRKTLVKHFLAEHGKTLDETPFNNQMGQLITKSDCGIPLYISLACNYLKMFATFENLTHSVQNLPSTLAFLLEHVVVQLEKQYGAEIIQKLLIFLCNVKEGLRESELHFLLSAAVSQQTKDRPTDFQSIVTSLSDFSVDDMIKPVEYRTLVHVISIFMLKKKSDSFMKLSQTTFKNVLKKLYLNKTYEEEIIYCHKLLAAGYEVMGDHSAASSLSLRSFLFHLYYGHCYKELSESLCSLNFLQTIFEKHAEEGLLHYYTFLIDLEEKKSQTISSRTDSLNVTKLKDYQAFLTRNLHVLSRYPQTTKQQALNEPINSFVYKYISEKTSLIECVTRSAKPDFRMLTINMLRTATCVALHNTDSIAAVGNEDGFLKLFDLQTGKLNCSLKGHKSSITSICFVGKDRVCSSSADNCICLWSISDYCLIKELKGHKRLISCCISDPIGKFILSSSWDCTVRFWNAYDGSETSVISEFRCPVNCVTHHPYSQLFACGLWNGNVEIWNSLSLKKDLVLRGHSGSVRFLAYSADGMNIVSSSITSEVFIWSSEEGFKIGVLKGHILPVNSIYFSLRNQFFVSASDDRTLKVWSNQQGQPVHTISESKFCPVHFMEIVKTNLLAVCFQNGYIYLVDLINGHITEKFEDLSEQVSCFSRYCGMPWEKVAAPQANTSIKYGTVNGKIMELGNNEKESAVHVTGSSIKILIHTETFMACGTSNGDVCFLKICDEPRQPNISQGAHEGSVTALSVIGKEETAWALSSSTDMTMKLWKIDFTENMPVSLTHTFGVEHRDYVTSCSLLSVEDGTNNIKFITGSSDNTVAYWDNGKRIVLKGLHASVISVFERRNYVFGCSNNGEVVMWTKNGSLISKVEGAEQISSVACSIYPDVADANDVIILTALAHADGSISINKPFQKNEICTFQGHSKGVASCHVNKNDDVISCSPDRTVNVWKIPEVLSTDVSYHEGNIMGVLVLPPGNLAITADINGNLILWSIEDIVGTSMKYCCHKKFEGGLINLITLLDENRFMCATTFPLQDSPKYILTILKVEKREKNHTYYINEEISHYISDEATSLNFIKSKEAILIGLKSGYVVRLLPEYRKHTKITNNWILASAVSGNGATAWFIDEKGILKQYSLEELLDHNMNSCKPNYQFDIKASETVWATAMCPFKENLLYVGDSKGFLRLLFVRERTFERQVHTDAITGICIAGSHVVTCSADKYLKIWTFDHKQVAQFHSPTPISRMVVFERKINGDMTHFILIGSMTGNVHLLKWWPKKKFFFGETEIVC